MKDTWANLIESSIQYKQLPLWNAYQPHTPISISTTVQFLEHKLSTVSGCCPVRRMLPLTHCVKFSFLHKFFFFLMYIVYCCFYMIFNQIVTFFLMNSHILFNIYLTLFYCRHMCCEKAGKEGKAARSSCFSHILLSDFIASAVVN